MNDDGKIGRRGFLTRTAKAGAAVAASGGGEAARPPEKSLASVLSHLPQLVNAFRAARNDATPFVDPDPYGRFSPPSPPASVEILENMTAAAMNVGEVMEMIGHDMQNKGPFSALYNAAQILYKKHAKEKEHIVSELIASYDAGVRDGTIEKRFNSAPLDDLISRGWSSTSGSSAHARDPEELIFTCKQNKQLGTLLKDDIQRFETAAENYAQNMANLCRSKGFNRNAVELLLQENLDPSVFIWQEAPGLFFKEDRKADKAHSSGLLKFDTEGGGFPTRASVVQKLTNALAFIRKNAGSFPDLYNEVSLGELDRVNTIVTQSLRSRMPDIDFQKVLIPLRHLDRRQNQIRLLRPLIQHPLNPHRLSP